MWIFLAITTRFLWGFTTLSEKYFVEKRFKNPFIYVFVAFVLGLFSIILIPFVDFYIPSLKNILFIASASGCFFVGVIFYIQALKKEEASRINIMWSFMPIFTLVGGWFFLNEKLNGIQLLAFLMLVFGGFVASLHVRGRNRIKLSDAVLLMLFACLFFSIHDILLRFVTQSVSFSVVFIINSVFLSIFPFSLFLSKKFLHSFKKEVRNLTVSLVGLVAGINIISKMGLLFSIWALSLGPVALVNATEGFQAVFAFIMAVIATLFFPKILKEELDKRNVILKLTAMVLMIVGVVVISLG